MYSKGFIMFSKKRADGTFIEGLHHFNLLLPYLMPTRTESAIYIEQEMDITETLKFLKSFNRDREKRGLSILTFFQLFLCASVRTMAMRPRMNRFISGYRFYQRNEIVFNFVSKKQLTDEGEEINVRIAYSPFETLETLSDKVRNEIKKGYGDKGNTSDDLNALIVKMPRPLILLFIRVYKWLNYRNLLPYSMMLTDPFFSTIFLTNVGSVGIDAPYHHNFELGTCGLFVALGKVKKVWRPNNRGKLILRDVVKVTYTYDDRIADGIYAGKTMDLYKHLVENPQELALHPVLSQELLKEHQLRDYPAEN